MKLSEAIKKLDEELIFTAHSGTTDFHDALSLAIGCLKFRMTMKEKWAFSEYEKLLGEDSESEPTRTR